MRILFVCSRNRLRSPTAEAVFAEYSGLETASAGTSPDADTIVSEDLLEWAEIVFAMEPTHRRKLNEKFPSLMQTKKVIVLAIRDNYAFMDPQLVSILKAKVTRHLKMQRMD